MSEFYEMVRAKADPDQEYLHIVSFKFKEGVSAEEQAELMNECAELGEKCGGEDEGIKDFYVKPNIDDRKGFTWNEYGVFNSPEAFINFHQHPAHKEFAQKIAKVADWVCLDATYSFIL